MILREKETSFNPAVGEKPGGAGKEVLVFSVDAGERADEALADEAGANDCGG